MYIVSSKKYPVQQIFDYISTLSQKNFGKGIDFDNHRVFVLTHRTKSFMTNGTSCCWCGLEGTFFRIEKSTGRKVLSLYGNYEGRDILFTKDHIIPQSFGGAHMPENFQTMCAVCNNIKATSFEKPEEKALLEEPFGKIFPTLKDLLNKAKNNQAVMEAIKIIPRDKNQKIHEQSGILRFLFENAKNIESQYEAISQKNEAGKLYIKKPSVVKINNETFVILNNGMDITSSEPITILFKGRKGGGRDFFSIKNSELNHLVQDGKAFIS